MSQRTDSILVDAISGALRSENRMCYYGPINKDMYEEARKCITVDARPNSIYDVFPYINELTYMQKYNACWTYAKDYFRNVIILRKNINIFDIISEFEEITKLTAEPLPEHFAESLEAIKVSHKN